MERFENCFIFFSCTIVESWELVFIYDNVFAQLEATTSFFYEKLKFLTAYHLNKKNIISFEKGYIIHETSEHDIVAARYIIKGGFF